MPDQKHSPIRWDRHTINLGDRQPQTYVSLTGAMRVRVSLILAPTDSVRHCNASYVARRALTGVISNLQFGKVVNNPSPGELLHPDAAYQEMGGEHDRERPNTMYR